MAASPRYKVHDSEGTYQSSCKDLEAAKTVCEYYGKGSVVRDGGGGKIIYIACYDLAPLLATYTLDEEGNTIKISPLGSEPVASP